MSMTVKCKVTNKAYVAGSEYRYEPHTSGIFDMLQVFAGTGDEDDDELFYPKEMEKYFFWDESMMVKAQQPNKPKTEYKTYSPPPPPTPKVPDYSGPHGKRYKLVLDQIKSREEQLNLYPTDPNAETWKTEIETFKNTATKLKKKLDGKG